MDPAQMRNAPSAIRMVPGDACVDVCGRFYMVLENVAGRTAQLRRITLLCLSAEEKSAGRILSIQRHVDEDFFVESDVLFLVEKE